MELTVCCTQFALVLFPLGREIYKVISIQGRNMTS
jgi:hypothetical protein